MSHTTTSPNMLLVIPIVGEELGPDWADEIVTALYRIDEHDHSDDFGVKVSPAGMDMTSDLDMEGSDAAAHNVKNVRALRLFANASSPADAADLRELFTLGADGELWYRDGAGNDVRLTLNGAIDASTIGGISGLVAPASASYNGGGGAFVWEQDIGVPAVMDSGDLNIREQVAGAKAVTLKSASGLAADISLTLPSALATVATRLLQATTAGVMSFGAKVASLVLNDDYTTWPSGSVVQEKSAYNQDAQSYKGTTIPYDNTIPQITEGQEAISLAFTAKRIGNKIRIRWSSGTVATESASVPQHIIAAIFVAGTNNALASAVLDTVAANIAKPMVLEFEFNAADTNAHTYSVRIGIPDATKYVYEGWNGVVNSALGGVNQASSLEITEIAQ